MEFPSRYWKRLAWFALFVCLILWLAPRFSSDWQLKRRQRALIEAIESASKGKLKGLVSENYADDWGFKKSDILLALDDFSTQFLTLKIYTPDETWTVSGDEAAYSARLRFEGNNLGPIGAEIRNRAASLKRPVVFHWVKEGSWPWGWKLQKVTQEEIKLSAEYTPGAFRNATE